MSGATQDTSNNEIMENEEEYYKKWLYRNNDDIKKYYNGIRIRVRIFGIMEVVTCIVGLILSGYAVYIHGSQKIAALVVAAVIILAILCITSNEYRQMQQELSIVYDKILINDKYIISLKTAEKMQDNAEKKELYKKIVESILKDVRDLYEEQNEK